MADVQNNNFAANDHPGSLSLGERRRVECMQRVEQAISLHDLEALTDCFDPNYQSEFPAHLDRAFQGHAQMRKNWTQIFAAVPDIKATLLRVVADGETVWTEWDWKGTRLDGVPHHHRGVTIQTIPEDRITRAWLYMEPVQDGPGTSAAVSQSLSSQS